MTAPCQLLAAGAPHQLNIAACISALAELVIGNIVRRVLHIIREEMEAEQVRPCACRNGWMGNVALPVHSTTRAMHGPRHPGRLPPPPLLLLLLPPPPLPLLPMLLFLVPWQFNRCC